MTSWVKKENWVGSSAGTTGTKVWRTPSHSSQCIL
jgi:hypothetical protein